ncbi:MAG: type II toxin-antitoxin system RelE/ParE family toxin [Nanoarchaeota archaeon]|nr:type II toxin-antitoxin system RelE/ParE family toxin [Nanoarchaeota archaeon]MBU1005905.1 type II toxin-antitoxin system RelE/ParE family toxin [Nanoarchaeota archaeon]MBU1945390.1 type II toxin-antitoxin system RelE/ParE family toxin [Nanoarchaeota archaeon]
MYSVIILPKAKKQLVKLEKQTIEIILKKIYSIKEEPLHYIERLKDLPSWKLRIGDYRAILSINTGKKEIYIEKVGHRKGIYKS